MAMRLRSRTSANLTAVAVGAVLGGIAGWVFAPGYFWGLLVGGALGAGALRTGIVLFASDESGSNGR